MEKILTPEQEELHKKRIRFLFKTFTIAASITLLVIGIFALLVLLNGNEVFRNFVFNFFKQIPYVGQPLHLLIKSMNLVDLKMIYNTVLLPLMSVELIYYSVFLLIFEVILLILKSKFKKNSKDYLSFFVITIITSSIILFKQVNLIVLPIAQGSALASRNLLVSILMFIQLISIIGIARSYHQLGQFDLKEVIDTDVTKKMIKIGSMVTMISLFLFSSALVVANTQVEPLKDAISVDYVLDFKPAADGAIHLELPPKLVISSKLLGINLPKTIESGALLEYFAVSEVNIGEVVSQFVLDFVDNIAYHYLVIPMMNGLTTLVLIGLLVVYSLHKYKMPFSHLTLDLVQFIIALIISFGYLSKFGVILSMFGALMLVASGLSLYHSFSESTYGLKLQQLLNTKHQA